MQWISLVESVLALRGFQSPFLVISLSFGQYEWTVKFDFILFWIKVNITCNEGYKFSDDGGTEKSVVCEQNGWVYPQGYDQNHFPACDGIYLYLTSH